MSIPNFEGIGALICRVMHPAVHFADGPAVGARVAIRAGRRSRVSGSLSHLGALIQRPLRPLPDHRERPWGGTRFGGDGGRVGESWLAGPDSVVVTPTGPVSLDEISRQTGQAFVGRRAMASLGPRFPLLVKLIDAADWLSLQVHPDDAYAAELLGRGALGKAEAWLVLDAAPGAQLITGPRPGLTHAELLAAIDAGDLDRDRCEEQPAVPGDIWLLEPGTLHAIGAGTAIYEIEQPSDLTFRVSDWGRPALPGRPLHRAEARRSVRPESHARLVGRGATPDGGTLATAFFRLEVIAGGVITREPAGESLEILTVLHGAAIVEGDGWSERLAIDESVVIPAAVDRYVINVADGGSVGIGTSG